MDTHPDPRNVSRRTNGRQTPGSYPAMLAKTGALFVVVLLLASLTFLAAHDRDAARAAKTLSGTPDLPVAGITEPSPVISEFGPAFGAMTLELANGDLVDLQRASARDDNLAANTAAADAQDPLRRILRR